MGDGGFLGRRGVRARFLGQIDVLSGHKKPKFRPAPLALPWPIFSALKYKRAKVFAWATAGFLAAGGSGRGFRPDWRSFWPKKTEVSPRPFGVTMADFFPPSNTSAREGFLRERRRVSGPPGGQGAVLGQIGVLSGRKKPKFRPAPLASPWPIFFRPQIQARAKVFA